MVSKGTKPEPVKLAKKEKKVKKVFGFMEIMAKVDWYVKTHPLGAGFAHKDEKS
tara:strand:+ start:55 stop:216 length:162 start_codon:yes stop_codon:yes gene_type:complete